MRLTRNQWLMLGVLALGIVVSTGYTQGPGGGGKGKRGMGGGDTGGGMGKRGMGGGNFDFFAIMAGVDKDGKPNAEIDVAKFESKWGGPEATKQARDKMTAYLQSKGITSGKMSREVFQGYSEAERAARMGGGVAGGSAGGDKGGAGAGGMGKGGGMFGGGGDPEAMAKMMFERQDTNKDGKLTKEELEAAGAQSGRRSGLLDRFAEFDANKDGSIDLTEYTAYMKERFGGGGRGPGGDPKAAAVAAGGTAGGSADDKSGYRTAPVVTAPPPGLDARSVVYRYGKLPTRELPSWFVELDTDKDGQVGLYEWRAAGRATAEFKRMDINGDGFVTAEELLTVQRVDDSKDPKDAAALTFIRLNADPGSPEGGVASSSSPTMKGDRPEKKGGGGMGDWFSGMKGKGKGKGGNGGDYGGDKGGGKRGRMGMGKGG